MDRAIEWLDGFGKAGWITTMVVGFIVFWPVGLGILGYLIWSGRMGCWKNERRSRKERWKSGVMSRSANFRTSGNVAFDEYREETLKRLEDEQREFSGFLDNLRMAKDRAEFEDFMKNRATARAETDNGDTGQSREPQATDRNTDRNEDRGFGGAMPQGT